MISIQTMSALGALAAIATIGSFLLALSEHSKRPACPKCGVVLVVQNNTLVCNHCSYRSSL